MSVRKLCVMAAMSAVLITAAPRSASADWLITPFVGWNFSGSADVNGNGGTAFENKFEKKLDYGVSLASMGAGAVGFEVDFGYSPNFFATASSSNGFQFSSDSNVTTLMGNVILGAPIGGHGGSLRPYAVVGAGLIRTRVQDVKQLVSVNSKNDFGMDVGAGLMGFFAQNVGLRGDVRYFRGFRGSSDNTVGLGLSDFRYWRASLGVSFKF